MAAAAASGRGRTFVHAPVQVGASVKPAVTTSTETNSDHKSVSVPPKAIDDTVSLFTTEMDGSDLFNPNRDVIVDDVPTDTISTLDWSLVNDRHWMAGASWSDQVYLWHVTAQRTAVLKTRISNLTPSLSVSFIRDGTELAMGSVDGEVRIWQPSIDPKVALVVGQHKAGVKSIRWCSLLNAVVSGSWDKTVRYWDLRMENQRCQLMIQTPERVYGMDGQDPIVVAVLANNEICVYDVRNPDKPVHKYASPLKQQLSCVSIFPMVATGEHDSAFAVGSLEGRVHIGHVSALDRKNDFAFRHQRQSEHTKVSEVATSVNCIAVNEKHGTFATGGSDGGCAFWDKDSRQRLTYFRPMTESITACKFSRDGSLFAYSTGYDWSHGAEKWSHQPPRLFLHVNLDSEVVACNRVSSSE